MNNSALASVLLLGMMLMCIPIMVQMKWYAVKPWKSIVVSLALVITGVYGSEIWYYVENLSFGGRSFYGAIVLSPIIFFPLSQILQIPYKKILDFIPPAGCITLALVKLQCLRDGCCVGKILYIDENYMYVRFPSQIVEMVTFLGISVLLLYMSSKLKFRGKIFPWFLVLYGGSRFFLDFTRDIKSTYLLGLSAGSFWSLCSLIIGIVILSIMRCRNSAQR